MVRLRPPAVLPFDWLIEIISEIFILVNSKTFFNAYNIKIHVADKIFTSAKFEEKNMFPQSYIISRIHDELPQLHLLCLHSFFFDTVRDNTTVFYKQHGRTHRTTYCGHGYAPLRFRGNVVMRMGTQQQQQFYKQKVL